MKGVSVSKQNKPILRFLATITRLERVDFRQSPIRLDFERLCKTDII